MKRERLPYIFLSFAVIIASLFTFSVKAQDPQFSQFYASSIYLNPAFTGNTNFNRLSGTYRNQWPAIPGAFVSYSFSYDYNMENLHSGIGLIFTNDKAGSGGLRYTNIGGLYSYSFNINKKLIARAGVKYSHSFRNYNQSKLVFADQLIRDGASSSIESNLDQGISYADISVGGIVSSEKYWIGASFDHINQPNQSLLGNDATLPYKLSIHGGYKLLLEGDIESENDKSITIAANYKAQEKADQTDLGFYYNRNQLVFGLWYRGIPLLKAYRRGYANNDALILLIGLNLKQMRIGYTYDVTISKLALNSGGAHEVSLIYEWPYKKKRRRRFYVPCPKF